ncbi:transmembrane protein 114 [Ictalurus punctatus]|uniref:Transmembrane protein 114 n=1 Tax=Ictalurus punctatus TaxID=7998 RepID=W5UBT0_ICTPU|nr:transmembrane protein 114 [Ictalurus punctatus]
MELTLSRLAAFLASFGLLSFVCLIVAIGSDFWYIIDTSRRESNESTHLSSHSGLWRTCRFQDQCQPLMNPFGNGGNFTDSQRHILNMQAMFFVLLPLSVIVLFIGGMMGVISILARAHRLLLATGLLLLSGTVITLTGICVYVAYSAAAFREAVHISGQKTLEDLDIYFGWSLAFAAISFITELITAITFLLTSARLGQLMRRDQDRFLAE